MTKNAPIIGALLTAALVSTTVDWRREQGSVALSRPISWPREETHPLAAKTPAAVGAVRIGLRRLTVALAAVMAAIACAVVVSPVLASPGASNQAEQTPFGGSGYPVRPIQYDAGRSGRGLASVPCAGHARGVSACWVAKVHH